MSDNDRYRNSAVIDTSRDKHARSASRRKLRHRNVAAGDAVDNSSHKTNITGQEHNKN
jgi:hypothetical protein